MKDFVSFIREQGIVGLAVGFVLGAAVSELVNSLVNDIVNPIIGVFLGRAQNLTSYVFIFQGVEIKVGNFLSVLMDFLILTLILYIVFKKLGLEKLDKKKQNQIVKKIQKPKS